MRYYKLVGQTPVPVGSLDQWQEYLRTAQPQIAETIVGESRISTMFSGFDLTFGDPPKLFETMVIGGTHDGRMQRYSSWEEAVKGHDATVVAVMTTSPPDE